MILRFHKRMNSGLHDIVSSNVWMNWKMNDEWMNCQVKIYIQRLSIKFFDIIFNFVIFSIENEQCVGGVGYYFIIQNFENINSHLCIYNKM